jgi:hypothetical protein
MKINRLRFHLTTQLLCLAVLVVSYRAAAEDTNQWKIQVAGLRVVVPPANTNENARGAFFASPGVTVVATLTSSSGKIVSINQFESKLNSFADDKGTDLLAMKSEDPFNKPGFGTMDAKESYATVEMQVASLPAKGATSLNIAGKVSMLIASSSKQFTVESVEMKTNASFSLGDLPVMISAMGTNHNSWQAKDYPYSIIFSSLRNLECISSLEFFDPQGSKIAAHKSSWGGGFMGYMMEYDIKQTVVRAKIVATCWQDLKTVEVPISIKTGIGL